MVTQPPGRRMLALAVSSLLVAATAVLAAPMAASADTAPPSGTPSTVSSDALPTPQIDGVVWTQKVVGNTVYVGGNFTTARPAGSAPGVNTVARANMLAYDLTTGNLISAFAPTFNGQVRSIDASPDGSRIYVGGDFNQVSGQSRPFVAALNPTTGAVLPFRAVINAPVYSLAASGSSLFVGGVFTSVNGTTRTRVAQLGADASLTAFSPTVGDRIVRAVVASPDGSKVVIGGSFSSVNGSTTPGQGLAALDVASSQLLNWAVTSTVYDHGDNAAITSLSTDGTNFYGTGYVYGSTADGNLEGSFNGSWADGSINWVEDCHGDSYSVAALDDAVYVASHSHYCGDLPNGFNESNPRSYQHGLAFTKATTGTLGHWYGGGPYVDWAGTPSPSLLTWYPDFTIGTFTGQSQAAWSVATTKGYVLYGGEFPSINGIAQQGLVRFAVKSLAPNVDGPRLSGSKWVPTAVATTSGTVHVNFPSNWDRDNGFLTYNVYRNSGTTPVYTKTVESEGRWLRPQLGFDDKGLTPGTKVTYKVVATDPLGNSATSASVSTTVGSGLGAYASGVLADGATDFWRLAEPAGPRIADYAGTSTMTASSGTTFGTAGAIAGDSGTAVSFAGASTSIAGTTLAVPGPQTFSVEAWFKTTSTTGGKIVGFGDGATVDSGSYDRHIYMDADGHVTFGVYDGNVETITTPATLNDGNWHYAVGTLGSAGLQFYVDGKRVGSIGSVTSAQNYSGYWRLGGDNLNGWPGNQSSEYFTGSVDDVAVYPTQIGISTVRAHYSAAGGSVAALPTDAYAKTVNADQPLDYWRFDEAPGATTAQDSSGNGATATYRGGVQLGAPSALASGTGTSALFDGSTGMVTSDQQTPGPTTYSEELWFKTTTTAGGKLIGFGDSPDGISGSYDRHVWIGRSGQLNFGAYDGNINTITSPNSYNDGVWHQVVATQDSSGMKLYVDGAVVASNGVTGNQAYNGYWHIGQDNLDYWDSANRAVAADIDEVSVYGTALSADRVAAHYAAGSGSPVVTTPKASFTSSASGLTVAFDGTSSTDSGGSLTSYAWNFGDGTTGAGATASHTYSKSGTYTAMLTVTDNTGTQNTASNTISVQAPNVPPTASFTTTVSNLSVAFDGSKSSDSDGTVASYAWDFGDGSTGSGVTTTHVYSTPGAYTVTLTVTDNQGATGKTSSSVTATAPNKAPTAAFTTSSNGATLSVDGTSSADSDGTIASWAWDFGDGASATGSTAQHVYAQSGTYTVKLVVTDNGGATGSTSKSVQIVVPTAPSHLAQDGFGRTVTGGFGTADTGGAWTITSGASNFAVGSGVGTVSTKAGSTLTALLGSVSSSSTDVSTTFALSALPVASNAYFDLVGRRVGTTDYNARVIVSPSGVATLYVERDATSLRSVKLSNLTVTPGSKIQIRLQVFGTNPTTIQAKAWAAGTTEPAAWAVSATDTTAALQGTGSIGVRTYLGSSTTNGPVVTTIDDFIADVIK